jgi:N-acetyl-gamma-glutamylphosphate reductase
MKYMVDLKSLLEFKAKRDAKKANYNDISVTCTKHTQAVPMIRTKNGYKCAVCALSNNKRLIDRIAN